MRENIPVYALNLENEVKTLRERVSVLESEKSMGEKYLKLTQDLIALSLAHANKDERMKVLSNRLEALEREKK